MPDEKPIIVQTPPQLVGHPQVRLVKSDFEALIEQKGYRVWHDKSIKCPCSSSSGAANQSSCKNCGGAGWFYVNRTTTRMVVQSMNINTGQKVWSEERLGTANITARDVDRLSFMDRITLLDSVSEYSQVIFPKKQPDTNQLYGTLRYNPTLIYCVFLYLAVDQKPRLLVEDTDFTIDRNQIKLLGINYNTINNPTISVRYTHLGEYTVLDLPRDIITSQIKDPLDFSKSKDVQFPISAVGRRSHYMPDRNDYTNDNLFDNSFNTDSYGDQYDQQFS